MSAIKYLLDEIVNCSICKGKGITDEWSSLDGDFDFEWCDCNPNNIPPEDLGVEEQPY